MSLKTCGELMELGLVCNAKQLVRLCKDFMCDNIAAVLEGKHLDMLSDEAVKDVGKYYREKVNRQYSEMRPRLSSRHGQVFTEKAEQKKKNFKTVFKLF